MMASEMQQGKQGKGLLPGLVCVSVFLGCLPGASIQAEAQQQAGPKSLQSFNHSLPVAACKRGFSGSLGKDVYICFDRQGKVLIQTPVDRAQSDLRCNQRQLSAYLKAYQNPCYVKGPLPDLARSAFAALGVQKAWPDSSCLNIDRSIASFNHHGAQYVYSIAQAPGGGNARGTLWSLRVSPPRTDLLQVQAFPFLQCPDFYASEYCQWHLRVKKDDKSLLISADDIAQPCQKPFTWAEVLARLAQQFKACPAQALQSRKLLSSHPADSPS